MDRTTPHERAEKLLASAYPEMLECIAEALKRERCCQRTFEFNLSDAGEAAMRVADSYMIKL